MCERSHQFTSDVSKIFLVKRQRGRIRRVGLSAQPYLCSGNANVQHLHRCKFWSHSVDTVLSQFRSTPVFRTCISKEPCVILQYPPVFQIAFCQCLFYGFLITLISDTGGRIVLEWILEWFCERELSRSGYLYLLRSVLWHLWSLEPRIMSDTQVNFFQHQISCFVGAVVVVLLVVLKSRLVLSVLIKWFHDAFSFVLTFIDCIILIIFACIRSVNVILYYGLFRETSKKYNFCYIHTRISSGPYQEYSKRTWHYNKREISILQYDDSLISRNILPVLSHLICWVIGFEKIYL
jgi:hypothetical protein